MNVRYRKHIGRCLVLLMLLQVIGEPLVAESNGRVYAAERESGITVTTETEFLAALAQNQSPITIDGDLTVGEEADDTGKMYPLEIPEGTVLQGASGAVLNCRCPIQITGDGVVIQNIEMVFLSGNALGSVPHREIFLAGHSLTLDNVKTYLEGSGGSLGGLGGTEDELLPSVYAGGFENTSVGNAASFTVKNANSKTMFQAIYLSHDSGTDAKIPYTGSATLNIGPNLTVREGIYSKLNSNASIQIAGNGYVRDLLFSGNENTTLQINQAILNRASISDVGNLFLDDEAQFELKQGSFVDVTIQNGACLDLHSVQDVIVSGDFYGGACEQNQQTDSRGVLVLNKAGSLTVEGTVYGETIFHTDNLSFPGEYEVDKTYITSAGLEEGTNGFVLPEDKQESYELIYEANAWTVYSTYVEEEYPVVDSIEIVSAPTRVDIHAIRSSENIPAENAPYCEFVWKDEEGTAITTDLVKDLGLYFDDIIIGIKTEYWVDESALEQTDWANNVKFVVTEENPGRYYFYANEAYDIKTGSYTFLLCSEYCETLQTVADVKAHKEYIKAQFQIDFYDSTQQVQPTFTLTANDKTSVEVTYEQPITFSMQISPYQQTVGDAVNFYCGDILLGTAEMNENGIATLQYQTTEKKILIGESEILVKIVSTSELHDKSAKATVVLTKKAITKEEIASISLRDFTGDGSTKTTTILSMTDDKGTTYPVTGTAELPDAAPGSYATAKITEWSLGEAYVDWYQLPELMESVTVSPKVTIFAPQEPDPDPDPDPIPPTEPEVKEGLWIKPIAAQTYTGKAIKPPVEVYEGETLLTKKDYTVTYSDNIKAGTATVKVTGRGNYQGSDTTKFVIDPKSLESTDITVSNVYAFMKNNAVKHPKVTVKFGKKTLSASTERVEKDYKFEWPVLEKDKDGNIIEQSHTIMITGVGNYTGSIPFTYDILPEERKLMSHVKVEVDKKSVSYFEEFIPEFTLTYGTGIKKETLQPGEDYTVKYPDKIVLGKNIVTFVAKEGSGFYGSKTFAVTITGKPITKQDITVEGIKESYDFTGTEIRVGKDGRNTLIIKDTARKVDDEAVRLEEGVDYTLSYKKNLNAGTATVTILGKGGYTGKKNVTFKILRIPLNEELVTIADSAVYTKNGAKVQIHASYNGIPLVEKKDYTVIYQNHKKLGENSATVKITGKGNFSKTIEDTYSVLASDKDKITFKVEDTPVPTKMSRLHPKMSIVETATNKKLAAQKDYHKEIQYYITDTKGNLRKLTDEDLKSEDIVNTVVTARLTLVNDGFYDTDYEDETPITIDTRFRLYVVKASALVVEKIPDQPYTGKARTPDVVVKQKDGKILTPYNEETGMGDYIVTYSKNVNVGTAKATITFVNNAYGGSKTVSFRIIKKVLKFNLAEILEKYL